MAPKRAAGSEADTSERRPPAPKASGSHAKPSESFFLLLHNPYLYPRIQALISATFPLTTTLPGTLTNSKIQQLALQNVPAALGDIPFGLTIRNLRPLFSSLESDQIAVADKWQMPFNDLATRVLSGAMALSNTKLSRLYRIRLKEGNEGNVPGLEGYSCWKDTDFADVDTVRGEDGLFSTPKDLTNIASSITIPIPTSIEALFVLFGREAFIKEKLQEDGRPKHNASTQLQSVVKEAFFRFWVTFSKRYTDFKLATPVLHALKQQVKWLKDAVKLQEELEAYADIEEKTNEIEAKSRSLHALLNLLTPSFGLTQPHSETHPQLDDIRDILVKYSSSTAYLETLRMDTDPLMQKAISNSQGEIVGGSLLDFSHMTEALNNISDLADTSLSLGLNFWRSSGISDLLEWADMQGGWAGLTAGSQASDPPREHDLAGALEMMARAFSGSQGAGGADYRRGVLVADEPGVNGTLQSILVILGFGSLARRFVKSTTATYTPIMLPTRTGTAIGSNITRLIKDTDWKGHRGFAETGKLVPRCLPSIIVAPSDAANYFEAAIQRYSDTLCVSRIKTEASASRIISRVQREIEVWKHATEYDLPTVKLNCPADQVVIITPSLLYKLSAAHGQPTARLRRSLFDLEFLVAVLAEAHCFRTPGNSLSAVNQLTTRAAFVIAQTPTPILTTALDVCHIAYAANFVHAQTYLGSANPPPSHYAQLKKSISNRRLGVILGKEVLAQVWFESAARASNSTLTHSENVLAARLQETLGLEGIEAGLYVKATTSALEVHTRYLVRRCRNDLDSQGHPILKLGMTTSTVLTVTLSEEETDNYRTYIEGRRLAGMSMTFTGVETASIAPAYYAQKFDTTVLSSCPTKMKAVLDLIELIRCREKLLPEEEKSKIVIWGGLEILPELKRHAKARSITLLSLTGYTLPDDRKPLVHQVNQHRQHPADGGDGTTDIVFCNGIIGESSDLSRCNVVIHLSLPANRATYERRNARSHFSPHDPKRKPSDISIYSIIALNSPDVVVFLAAVLKAGMAETLYGYSGEGRVKVLGWIEGIISDAERKEMKGSEGRQLGAGVALTSTQAEVFKDDDLESFWKFLEPAIPHPTTLGEKARVADDPREFRAREKEAIRLGKEDQLKPRPAAVITEEELQKRGSQSINSWIYSTFLELEACRQLSDSSANTKMTAWIRRLTPIFEGNTAWSDLTQTQLGEIDDILLEMKANDRIARYITRPGSSTPVSKTPTMPLRLDKLPRDNDGVWLWWNNHKADSPTPAVFLDRSARIALGLPPDTVKSSPRAIIDLTAGSDDEEPV